ncbi:NTF2 fold immunity protein [Serratia ureilytica]|uniref:NTF2 fold immunity protein n=1 Tax=Serratia ureilytica TaxID=300181 RepID=UPI001D18FC09|nr:NTF2 fold immunity protein [Serratia ureilytica]MCC4105657.1 NTF2 fold immunity protein [Serratia ureilytica]
MTPVDRLRTFIEDMLEWETTFQTQRRSESYMQNVEVRTQIDSDANRKLQNIFTEHLSRKALNSIAKARLDTMGTQRPPDYAQSVSENTEEQAGKHTHIETFKEKGLAPRRRYSLVMEDGVPKIDSVAAWDPSEQKWDRRHSI